MDNTQECKESPRDKVAKRFASVSLEEPINAKLFELALVYGERSSPDAEFTCDMHPDLPNAAQILEMRRKHSLLPLDSVEMRLSLPSLPSIIMELQQAVARQDSSEQIAALISQDPKLTMAVLSLANSPLYGLTSKVESLPRAVTYIGTREISALALGVRLLAMFEENAPRNFPLTTFWKHSLATAVLAHEIASLCRRSEPERFFTAGLLHDVGRVVLCSNFPDLYAVVMALHQERSTPLNKGELAIFDVDHAMIGGLFFAKWGLPSTIVNSALFHHSPQDCVDLEGADVVYVANQLATALGIGCNRVYTMKPGEEVWNRLGLDVEQLTTLVETIEGRLNEMFTSLFPSPS